MEIKKVDPKRIKLGSINRRTELGDLTSLTENIKKRYAEGKRPIIVPLLVKRIEDEYYYYEVIDGKRRLQGALMSKIPEVDVILETEINDPSELVVISLLSNEFRKEFSWLEKAMMFKDLQDLGLTYSEIGNKVGLSNSRISAYINTYEKWILTEVPSTELLSLETTYEIVNKCPEEDIVELVEYIWYYELTLRDTRKVLSALRDFYASMKALKDSNEDLYKTLHARYYPYRFNPAMIELYEKEKNLKTGEAQLKNVFLDISEYPTEESAIKYATEHHGELIGKTKAEGWQVAVIPYTITDIATKFYKIMEKL